MTETTSAITGHLAMSHAVSAASPRPTASPIAWVTGPVTTRAERDHREQDDADQGHQQLQRAQLVERPALLDLVDRVGGPAEGADVARGRPQRGRQPDDERETGGLRSRRDLLDRSGERVGRRRRPEGVDDLQQLVGGLLRVADQADDREQRDHRGEDGEHAVVGQRRRPVGAVVVLELGDGALQDTHPRPLAEVGRARPACAGRRGRGTEVDELVESGMVGSDGRSATRGPGGQVRPQSHPLQGAQTSRARRVRGVTQDTRQPFASGGFGALPGATGRDSERAQRGRRPRGDR